MANPTGNPDSVANGARLQATIAQAIREHKLDELGQILNDRGFDFVTQYGNRAVPAEGGDGRPFRCNPRGKDLGGISAFQGLTDFPQLVQAVSPGPRRAVTADDGLRYTQAKTLTEAGFVVVAAPTKRNARHVRIEYPGEWTAQVARRFDDLWSRGTFASTAVDTPEDDGSGE